MMEIEHSSSTSLKCFQLLSQMFSPQEFPLEICIKRIAVDAVYILFLPWISGVHEYKGTFWDGQRQYSE